MSLTRQQLYLLTQSLNSLEKETGLLKSSLIPLWQATSTRSRYGTISRSRTIDLKKSNALDQLKLYFGNKEI